MSWTTGIMTGRDRIDWLINSSDGNLIEHAWDALEIRVTAPNMPPRTIPELEITLRENRDRILQELFNNLTYWKKNLLSPIFLIVSIYFIDCFFFVINQPKSLHIFSNIYITHLCPRYF